METEREAGQEVESGVSAEEEEEEDLPEEAR